MAFLTINVSSDPGGGEGTSFKRLMGTCRWMGSHVYDWIDHIGVALSIELLKWFRTLYIIGFLEVGQFFIFTVSKRNRCLYCGRKAKCSSFNLKMGQFIKVVSD